jgi:hypothetical protein
MSPVALTPTPNRDILMLSPAGFSRIDSEGIIHAVSYLHQYGFLGDGGPAISAITNQLLDVTTDIAGNIFIANTNNRIRRIDAQTGIINTVAGNGPTNGFERYGKVSYCGDGGAGLHGCR